jgi:acyl-CoA synthetase (AMP-forming)/AMP-acid ligase II
MLMRD